MGLYLCVFADAQSDDELDGVEVGGYDDFGEFREAVAGVEPAGWGSGYPILMFHSDCTGDWSVDALPTLRGELSAIRRQLSRRPAVPYGEGWQREVAQLVGHTPSSMADSFIDVDGEVLLDRLIALVDLAITRSRPVTFA